MKSSLQKTNLTKIDITWSTFFRGISFLLVLFIAAELIQLIGLICLAVFFSVMLDKVITGLESKGISPRYSFLLVLGFSIICLALIFTVIAPAMISQLQSVGDKLPQIKKDLVSSVPHGVISSEMQKLWSNPEGLVGSWGQMLIKLGSFITKLVEAFAIVFTFAFYFLLDGKRTFDWLISFFSRATQKKLKATGLEMKNIVAAYVTGQFITSALAFVFTAILLNSLKVPAWLILALFGAIMDVVPVIGFLVTMAAVGLMALTVSTETAVIAIAASVLYQGFENYIISPRVYGSTLQLSSLAVLMAIAVGGILGGPLGIVLALPIAAAYPPIERIWLKRYLGEDVVEKHAEIEKRNPDIELTH